MFRTVLWMLRRPRYAALGVLMVIVAGLCVLAGTWQISRFEQKVHDNNVLRANAHDAVVPLTTSLVPLVGQGPAPTRDQIRYRAVAVTGTYLGGPQQFVAEQQVNGQNGFFVLAKVRTSSGVLLVVRGFAAENRVGLPPAVPPLPAGRVRLIGRLQTPDTKSDGAGKSPDSQIASVNPTDQAARLGAPVYNAYIALKPHQPGTSGLTALPAPDMTNPAGGAYEWQHFAYIIQWYFFALLALAAPFLIARRELISARRQFLGVDPDEEQFDETYAPALTAPRAELAAPHAEAAGGGELVARGGGALARRDEVTAAQWERAAALADRYGQTLGPSQPARLGPVRLRTWRRPAADLDPYAVANGAARGADLPHRSEDAYHGAYNDYLWELGLADGAAPDTSQLDGTRPEVEAPDEELPDVTPRTIDVTLRTSDSSTDDTTSGA